MRRQKLIDKKRVLREKGHLTRPPRLEGAVKEAMMQPTRKKKQIVKKAITKKETRAYTEKQRKDYQLRSKKH